jgi:glucuronate isomerase
LGDEIENGEIPNDLNWVGKIVQDICFYNARNYFNWQIDVKTASDEKVIIEK